MSSGFVTESEASDLRKKRQEEWEKVRQAEDPLERPEEPYDSRSLFDRLQEQKQKKDLEFEEAHKLKNMIKGLDDDEIEFLDLVDRSKIAADRIKNQEEEKELNDYRNRVATLQEKSLDEKIHSEVVSISKPKVVRTRNSQTKLLKGVVVKMPVAKKRKFYEIDTDKVGDGEDTDKAYAIIINDNEKQDVYDLKNDNNASCKENDENTPGDECKVNSVNTEVIMDDNGLEKINKVSAESTGLTCIGILPGLGCYNDTSSDESSDSEPGVNLQIQMDLLGRKITKKDKEP